MKTQKIQTLEYKLPAYWACYIFNGDASGLEDRDQEEIDSFIECHSNLHFVDCGESYFSHTNDANSLAGDVCNYTAHVLVKAEGEE